MKLTKRLFIAIAGAAIVAGCGQPGSNQAPEQDYGVAGDGIYGDDNRLDLYQVTNSATRDVADSTVALISSGQVRDRGDGYSSISASTYGPSNRLCRSERFYSQPRAAFCSGTLVAPDTVVTAGHCITGSSRCGSTKFVFGYALKSQSDNPKVVRTDDVYRCSRVVKTINNGSLDMAVVKLNRSVTGHRPARVAQNNLVTNAPIMAIGHPKGLPTKVAAGAYVRSIRNDYYVTNTDTYAGNSGSGVFNSNTGEMEGILVRGAADFVYAGSCKVSKRFSMSGGGEHVTKITKVLPYL